MLFQVIHAALDLEPVLLGPMKQLQQQGTSSSSSSSSSSTPRWRSQQARQLIDCCSSWDTPSLLRPVLARWLSNQVHAFRVWVQRQMEKEDWRPLARQQVGVHLGWE